MRFITLLLLLCMSPVLLAGQTSFKRLFGTSGNDEAYFVEVLGDGSFIVAGQTTPGPLGGQDAMLTKFSANGTVQWSRVFGGTGTDAFQYLLPCSDGNFIAAGETTSFGAGNVDIYLVKFDPNGNAIWERTAGGSNQETVSGITEVSDGYVVSGGTQSFGAGFWDIFVQKIDLNGNHQWSKAWGGGGGDIAGEPFPAPNNEIWVTGFIFVNTGNHDPILFRLAANGNLLNGNRHALPVNNGLASLGPAGSGLLSGGGTWVGNNHQPLVFRFNASGGIVWAKRYPITGGDFSCHAEPTADGGAIFSANELDSDTPDAVLVKLDGDGEVDWAKAHSFEGLGRLFHVRQAPDGGYVAVGYALGTGRDFFILKTNALGEVQECCPDDISVSAVSLSPSPVSITPAEANGPASASNTGTNQPVSLSSLNICNGPICCIYPTAVIAPPPPITCNDPLITLDGTGSSTGSGFSYQWTGPGIVSGATTLNPVVNQGGLYTLVVTETATGCFTPATVVVADLSQPPLAVATAPATVTCASPEVVVSGTGSSTGPDIVYQWTGPGIVSGANSLNLLVDLGGTYTLTVTNTATGCESQVSVTVNQNTTLPTVEAGPGQQLDCDSPVVQLDGTGSSSGPGFSYQWTGPGVAGGGNTLQPTVNQPGTYTLTVTNTLSGCQATDQVLVNADFTFPVIQLDGPVAISCAQPQIELDATGSSEGPGFSIQWTTTGGQILQGANTLTPLVGAAGLYTLTIINTGNGCSNAEGISVTGNPAGPEAEAGPGGELTCSQTQLELQGLASGPVNNYAVQWTAAPGQIASGAGTLNPVVISAGLYILTVTDTLLGCTASDSVAITQDGNLPQIQLSVSNDLTCSLSSATLDGTGSSSGSPYLFAWSTPDGNFTGSTDTLVAVVDQAGQYTLSITDTLSDCTVSQTVQVVADTVAPAPVIAQPSVLTCAQPEVSLEASVGGLSDFSFEWTTPNGQPLTTLIPLIDQPGVYQLEVTNLVNGCSGSTAVLVESDFTAPLVDAGPGGVLTCADTVLTLSGTADGGGALLTMLWATTEGNILSGQNTFEPVIDAPGTYVFFAVNEDNGCVDSSLVVITANQTTPIAEAGDPGLLNCYQPSLSLDGSGSSAGPSLVYAWTTANGLILEGATTPTPVAGQAGLYLLTVTDTVNQCQSADSVWVNEDFELPQADAGMPATLTCAFPEVQLNGSGSQGSAFSYAWTSQDGLFLSGEQTLTPVVAAAGLYQLLVTNQENGCSATDQVEVQSSVVLPLAVAETPPPLTCQTTQVMLNGEGSETGPDISYAWTTSDGLILSGANILQPQAGQAGLYQLTVTNAANGCSNAVAIVLSIDTLAPQVQAGPDASLTCAVQIFSVNEASASSGPQYAYAWTTSDGAILSGVQSLNPEIGAPGTYVLQVTNQANGCQAADTLSVFQDTLAPLALVAEPSVLTCATTLVTLDATASSQGPQYHFSWTTPDGNILSGADTPQPEVDVPGSYELLITNSLNSCTSSVVLSVLQDTLSPLADAGAGGLLSCAQTQLTLNGMAGAPGLLLSWTTTDGHILSGAQSPNPQIDQPGTYTLTVTDPANGCEASDEVVVEQDTLAPVVVIAPPGQLTCAQEQLVLSATGPAVSYLWSSADGLILGDDTTLTLLIGAPGLYVLTAIDDENGCTGSDSVTVTQNTVSPQAEAGPDLTLSCAEDQAVLSGSGSALSGQVQVSWTTVDGQILSGGDQFQVFIGTGGWYWLAVTDQVNGCSASDSVFVAENAPYQTGAEAAQPPCTGDPGRIAIGNVSGGTPPYLFSIDGGQTFQIASIFENLSPGSYSVIVQDALGCETEPEAVFLTDPIPVAIELEATAEMKQGEAHPLLAEVNVPVSQVVWSPAAGLSCSDCLSPLASPLQTTQYFVEVADANGCKAAASVWVYVDERGRVFVPNIFSPNGDGENDVFYLFADPANIREVRSFLVFDRWGERVFEYYRFHPNNPAYGWDGTFRGEPQDPAVYAWFAEIEFVDGRVELFEGPVTLIR